MVLDGYVLARTMVKYFPEVTKTLGGGSGGTYSFIKTLE